MNLKELIKEVEILQKELQSDYHKHFYQIKKYDNWTSGQLNANYQEKLLLFIEKLKKLLGVK